MLKNFQELKVWQKANELCLEIYNITKNYPAEEKFGLTSQTRRASVSRPSNIAEVERMFKALNKSLENKTWSLDPLDP